MVTVDEAVVAGNDQIWNPVAVEIRSRNGGFELPCSGQRPPAEGSVPIAHQNPNEAAASFRILVSHGQVKLVVTVEISRRHGIREVRILIAKAETDGRPKSALPVAEQHSNLFRAQHR